MMSLCLLVPGKGELLATAVQEAFTKKANSLPSCVPGFHQIPAFNLSVPSHRLAWLHSHSSVFYLWPAAEIQNSRPTTELYAGLDLTTPRS